MSDLEAVLGRDKLAGLRGLLSGENPGLDVLAELGKVEDAARAASEPSPANTLARQELKMVQRWSALPAPLSRRCSLGR